MARGERREVSLMLLDEGVEVGDYVLVQQGRFAYERLDATDAQQALALIDSIIEDHGGSDLRAWQGR